ncbi:MAG: benzoate 1,2-dioxygenase electron transfer component BenC [Sphingomonas sp.]|nr:benzoate 1,2-dioxygenase electron transfer component BenC [Sphingomonas sp.]MDX3884884.1 benzoate 1,2-dioxygenase electron transfer component BenC [Sphingomonas sp.]
MTFRIALNFEDGATRFIDCNAGEKVLDAAYRNKINLPMDCSDGVCGTCKCRAEQGDYDLGDDYIDDALTAEEAEEGLVLTCQMVPSSDCVIAVPVPSSACKVKPEDIAVELVAIERLSPHRVRVSIKATDAGLPAFLPGQYVNFAVPGSGGAQRSYSFSSAPGAEVATFLIRNIEGGRMGDYLGKRAATGDRLILNGPLGSFYLREPRRPMLMLAGGTGIAPILSMLEELAAKGANGHAVRLLYGAHDAADLVEVERIEALAARIPGFTFATTCSGAGSDHPLTGHVTDHFGAADLNGGDADIYLCGPPEMVEAVRAHVASCGATVANLYYEKFVPAQAEALAA